MSTHPRSPSSIRSHIEVSQLTSGVAPSIRRLIELTIIAARATQNARVCFVAKFVVKPTSFPDTGPRSYISADYSHFDRVGVAPVGTTNMTVVKICFLLVGALLSGV